MRLLCFDGFPHTDSYASATQSRWARGEEREVVEAEAAYLLDTFPGAFRDLSSPAVPSAPSTPVAGRAIPAPPNHRMIGGPDSEPPQTRAKKRPRRKRTDTSDEG